MCHNQPPTPLQIDNAMADALCNGKIQPKLTKATDMRFHWLRYRELQKQLTIYIGDQANETMHTTEQITTQKPTKKVKETNS